MMPSLRRDYNMAVNDAIRRTHTVVLARLAPGLLGLCSRLALGEGGGLALAGAGRRVELAAEALVLGLQVTEASLKGLAAGTQDGLHTCIIREAGPQLRRPRPQDRDQRELHPLNKYFQSRSLRCPQHNPDGGPSGGIGMEGVSPGPARLRLVDSSQPRGCSQSGWAYQSYSEAG